MKNIAAVFILICLTACSGDGALKRPIASDINAGIRAGYITPDIKLSFAKDKTPLLYQPQPNLGVYMSNKKANSFWRSSQKACRRAFHSALISLQKRVIQSGGTAVVNIYSYYNGVPTFSDETYRCMDGFLMSGVALRGTIVKE